MKHTSKAFVVLAVAGITSPATAQLRFFFAYGDANLATLQTKNYAGVSNPSATLGSEIPSNAPLKVWKRSEGKPFRVSVMAVRTGGNADRLYQGGSVLAMYDRVAATSSVGTIASELSFLDRMINFADISASASVCNFASLPAYYNDGSIYDNEGDGEIDYFQIQTLNRVLRPQYTGDTSSPRGVGLSVAFTLGTPGAHFKVGYTPVRFFDLTLRSNINPFETYNGLSLFVYKGATGTPNVGSSTFLGSNDIANTGTNLTLQAVPEPSTATALVASLIALRYRNRRK